MTLLLLYTAGALALSFLCSLLESVWRASQVPVHRPWGALSSLHILANTVGATLVGAQVQALWGSARLALAASALALGIWILVEIVPRRLGALYFRQLTPWCARMMPLLMAVTLPFVWFSEQLTRRFSNQPPGITVSREQIVAMARLGEEQGSLEKAEARIVASLLHAGSLRVYDMMTPRTVMASLDEATTVGEAIDRDEVSHFTRLPLWRGNPEEIVGYVFKPDILSLAARDQAHRTLQALRRRILMVPDTLAVAELFERLLDRRQQIATVVDEYGGVVGIVTLEDVIETLLGAEIVDEADAVSSMRDMARSRWSKRAPALAVSGVSSAPPPPNSEQGS